MAFGQILLRNVFYFAQRSSASSYYEAQAAHWRAWPGLLTVPGLPVS
jgi:hypothetical protein